MTSHIFRIDMLRAKVAVRFDDKCSVAREFAQKFLNCPIHSDKDESIAGFAIAHCRRVAIWLGPDCKRQQVFHECYHATQRLLEEIGSEGKDEELNAHLHEFITERVLVLWEKNKQKGK